MPPSRGDLLEAVASAHGLLSLLTDRVDAELLDAAPNLRAIANYAVGVDNVDVPAATRRGIAIGVTPDVLTAATADLAMALLLAAVRRLPEAARDVGEGRWRTWDLDVTDPEPLPVDHALLEAPGALVCRSRRPGRRVRPDR